MAFNNSFNGNGEKKKEYRTNVYSRYSFSNAESAVDPTRLSFTYWSDTLKVSIQPRKNTNNDEISYDTDNGIDGYLNYTKARIMADIIRDFKLHPENYDLGKGVPTGSNIMTICNGKEYGVDCPCLVIRRIDENGTIISSFSYQFKQDYHYAITGYGESGKDFDKDFDSYKNIELDQFMELLDQYCLAMTGAQAFAVVDQLRFDHNRITNKLDSIMGKLGIENTSGGRKYSGGGGGSGYFNRASGSGNSNFNQASLDDYDDSSDE